MPYGISGGSGVARVGGRAGTASLRVQMGESMRQYIPVITLAAALALLLGVLLPSDNVVHAANPAFDDDIGRSVPENTPPGTNIGGPISATDADEDTEEFGNTLTYSLQPSADTAQARADAAAFDIDPSTGQLITKAPLDTEGQASYTVRVKVDDGEDRQTPITRDVTISVLPVSERPGAPAAPVVASTASDDDLATFELKVIWYAPDDMGDDVTGYDVEYKKTTENSFTELAHGSSATTATITGLEADTSYQVRVRADNSVGDGPWSLSSAGSTNKKDNDLPLFREDTVQRNMLENADPGLVVGSPVSATDNDNVLPLTYRLQGPDADSFDLQASSGQIRTKRGVVYDFETKSTFRVAMTVSDGQGGSDARAVTITIVDVPESPSAPARPTVRATPKSSRSLDVSWTEPENMGPAITGYDVRYRKSGSNTFRTIQATGTTATITPQNNDGDERLEPGQPYEVSVRANNGEIIGEWSAAGTGRTSRGNSNPVFNDRDSVTRDADGNLPAATTRRAMAENTPPGRPVGDAVGAVDGDGDRRAYRLVAVDGFDQADVDKFGINESTGQILTKASLNHEDRNCGYDESDDQTECTYTVKVQVWDGRDEHRNEQDTATITEAIIDDEITVNIMVSDVAEKPAAPTVTVTSLEVETEATTATLTVTWDKPENTGPGITGYVVECSGAGITSTNPCPQPSSPNLTAEVMSYVITVLTPNSSYSVRVRAKNDEGDGPLSTLVRQSTSKQGNTVPSFSSPPAQLYVTENAPAPREPVRDSATNGTVVTVSGTDTDAGDTLTYRLEGPGAGRFEIDRNGQIQTRSKLNYEDPECNPDEASCSYRVRVKISDPNGGSVFHSLTINVTNADEPPSEPAAPRVTATTGSGWSLKVTWDEPRNTGPAITGYQIRYRKSGDGAWRQWPADGSNVTDRSAKITTIPDENDALAHLEPRTQYEVQVRALNGEGDSTFADATNWSFSGRGTTAASNKRPTFVNADFLIELEVDENTRSGQNVGSAVEATDPDSNRLTYTLEGPGKDSFTITSDGQIRTRAALNHEETSDYLVTVKVNDGQREDNSVAAKSVSITVLDRPEVPSAPRAPTVAGIPGSTKSVRVTWDEPATMGPPITHYSVQYAVSGSRDAFDRVPVPIGDADRSVVITGLTAGTRYDVQVRAESDEGHGDYSRSGTGSPNPDVANRVPAFSGGALTFNVAENTPPGADVGSPVAALDPDGDTLTYALEGTDADSFDIIATNGAGQIQTSAALNYEEKSSYSVAVRVRDGRGGTDAVSVTIRVTDVDEAPDTPFAPTVTTASSASLSVSWEAPDNQGPPITDYDYRYRAVTDSVWTEVTNTPITATAVTIDELTASTSYDVEVLAKNAEGMSDWSNPGNGSTAAPGANSPPVFSEGASATRSVSVNAATGTPIGDPVTATDADSGDTLTYSLEGRDAALFTINETNGQLLKKSGVTLLVNETYTLTVAADDGIDIARIAVTINATAAPPNNPPVFTEGASAARTVSATAPAGTPIGVPLTATDADAGATLAYSLEGADAASFGINTANGQLLTLAGVTLDRTTYTVEVVASDGSATSRITVTITVTPNRAPVFSEGGTATRSVAENEPAGTNVGSPVVATDLNQGDTLTYTLDGADAASFDIVSTSGQIRTSATLDYETKASYVVTVTATDRSLASASIVVTISVIQVVVHDCADGGAVADAANNRGLVSDCDALLSARNTLEGRARLDWSESTPIEQWEGVSISGTPRRVTGLNLMDRGLSGTIPDALGGLSMLTRLNLRTNPGLSGEIPDALGNLGNLRVLNLHSNSHTGAVPDLRRIAGLEELYLANNADYNADGSKVRNSGLTGRIPTWLNGMTNMEELWLWGNSLTGTVPNLSGMTSLQKLKLAGNDLTGGVPAGDMLPPNVTWLIIDSNPFGGPIPDLSSLSRLRLLWLHNNGLTGEIPAGTMFPASVDDLNLRDNMLTGAIPDLSSLDMATRVRLHGNMLTGEVPASLGRLDSLKQLWLWENDLTSINAGLGDLADTLIEIGLEGNPWNANACVPESLANVTTNDYTAAGIDVCDGS